MMHFIWKSALIEITARDLFILYHAGMEQEVYEFLKNKAEKLCVFSSVSPNGQPNSAVMGYAVQDDLSIIVSTFQHSRKVTNVQKNPHVALAIGWTFTEMSLQYEGNAKVILSGDAYKKADAFYYSVNPTAAQFKSPDTVFMQITPTWIRLTDLSTRPMETEEKHFFKTPAF